MNAVQMFALELFNGLSSPYLPPSEAYVVPETAGTIGAPQIHIWARNTKGRRLTMTRGQYTSELIYVAGTGGNRQATYELALWVTVELAADAKNADEAFALLIGNILKKAWSVRIVQLLSDPTTEEQSGLVDFGEMYTIDQAPAMALEAEGPFRLGALITLSIKEDFPG